MFPAQAILEQGFDTVYYNCSAPGSVHAGKSSGYPFLEGISHETICVITHRNLRVFAVGTVNTSVMYNLTNVDVSLRLDFKK